MRKIGVVLAVVGLLAVAGVANANTVTFTPSQIKAVMNSAGAPLSDASNQWGLWAVRARPIVSGGSFTITGAATSQAGWGTTAPSSYSWAGYGTNCAWFWDASGAEAAGTAANPLYMIMDVAPSTFWSAGFDGSGAWVGNWAHGPDGIQGTSDDLGTFYASGYDGGAGGTNVITAVGDANAFSFDFTLDAGATWTGAWEFLVDGSKYTLGTAASPGVWQEDFFGGYGTGGGLPGNMESGYMVPEPLTMLGMFLGLGSVGAYIRKRRMR